VCVPAVIGALAVWIQNSKKKNLTTRTYGSDFKHDRFRIQAWVQCGSAVRVVPGVSGLPYYRAPFVCVPFVLEVLAVRRLQYTKTISAEGISKSTVRHAPEPPRATRFQPESIMMVVWGARGVEHTKHIFHFFYHKIRAEPVEAMAGGKGSWRALRLFDPVRRWVSGSGRDD